MGRLGSIAKGEKIMGIYVVLAFLGGVWIVLRR